MLIGASHRLTICELLRKIADLHQGDSEVDRKTLDLLFDAEIMAKKITDKLVSYKADALDGMFEENETFEKDMLRRMKSSYDGMMRRYKKVLNIDKLKGALKKIPSMGGYELRERFNSYIAEMDNGLAVVEVGSWLGAGTAQMALAIYRHEKKSPMYVYDRFKATRSEVVKAKKYKVKLKAGMNTVPIVRKNLAPFQKFVKIKIFKKDARAIKYNGPKIGLFVLDTAKKEPYFSHVMKTFEPYFIPGKTVVAFMDYYYYLHKDQEALLCQKEYVEKSLKYTELEKFEELSCSIQRYIGDEKENPY